MRKSGKRLLVEKMGKIIHWVHAFKVNQMVLMGNINLSPATINFLLQEGIDTVFMSMRGKYRGRLTSQFGKNIDLRRAQFQKMEDKQFKLEQAGKYITGKLNNCRTLLRSLNRQLKSEKVINALHQIRVLSKKIPDCVSTKSLMGIEGKAAAVYFGCFAELIKVKEISFNGRNRRPPRDPVNVLLSLGYTLLANAVQTQVNIVGLDPYLGCLHEPEYGRPSLVLDIIEEFRPVLVDALVLAVINKKIIKNLDFYCPDENEPAAFDFAEEFPAKDDYPIILTHQGMKKFLVQFESKLNQKIFYEPRGKRFTYRDILLEQARLLVRCLEDEEEYQSYVMKG